MLVPLFLITGPAIPDIIISLGTILGVILILLNQKNYNLSKNYIFILSIIFWISLIFISFFSFNKLISFQDSLIFIRLLMIPICCYLIYFTNRKIFEYLLIVVLVLVVLVSIDTLYQFFNYTSKDGFGQDLLGFKSNWYGRLTGPFGDELIPGSYVSKFGFIGFVYFLINKSLRKNKFVQALYISLIVVVCFASGERMSLAAFSLGVVILLFLLKNYRLMILLSICISLISIFLITKYHPFYNDYKILESNEYHQGLKVEKYFKCENEPNKLCTRVINIQPSFIEIIKNFKTSAYGEIYLLSYKMFKDNIFTGIGINNFKKLCESKEDYKKLMVNYDCASHPHNTYIQWLTEGGVIVFLIFILYLYFVSRFIISNEGDKNLKLISIVLIIILFWPIMSTGSLIKNWYGISVFYTIAVSLCISRFKIKN